MEYTIKTLAELAGVTPRTLRWYDQEHLLKPLRTTEAGYRIYGPVQVARLQDILFYRELGMSLAAIRSILDDPAFDRLTALQNHLAELTVRRSRLDTLILTVQKTIDAEQGGYEMSDKEKFEAFKHQTVETNESLYGKEIREKYGNETVDRTNARTLSLTKEEYRQWSALEKEILTALAKAVQDKQDPSGPEGQRIAALHRRWLSYSWENYTPQAHLGLGQIYTTDLRFTDYYDQEVPGCAVFLRDAIAFYVRS